MGDGSFMASATGGSVSPSRFRAAPAQVSVATDRYSVPLPDWSPDGSLILYSTNTDDAESSEIYTAVSCNSHELMKLQD